MSAERKDDLEEMAAQAITGTVTEAKHPDGKPIRELCFTNDKTNPFIRQQFHIWMQSSYANLVGVMHAKHKDTDEIETLLVGVEVQEDGKLITYPLAKILKPEEQDRYLAPDGEGGYIGGVK